MIAEYLQFCLVALCLHLAGEFLPQLVLKSVIVQKPPILQDETSSRVLLFVHLPNTTGLATNALEGLNIGQHPDRAEGLTLMGDLKPNLALVVHEKLHRLVVAKLPPT